MEEAFKAFAKFGNSHSNGYAISLFNADKWMKQAGVIDGKRITTTDTGICFNQFHFKTRRMTYPDFESYIDALANKKKIDPKEIKQKLMMCTTPTTTNTTRVESFGVVGRMTDASKFTGVHKPRTTESGIQWKTPRGQFVKNGTVTGTVKADADRPPFWLGRQTLRPL